MDSIVYIRMKKKIFVKKNATIYIRDLAHISTNYHKKEALLKIPIYHMKEDDDHFVVIDSFSLIQFILQQFPSLDVELIGRTETIIQVKEETSTSSILRLCAVWIVLFVGTAMTIINFHYDVSMQEVQQRLHFLFTGKNVSFPLWIQIPYSIGLGVGMIIFLNHWFHKRINEEPSPLELELFNYQRDIDDYVMYYENELNDEKRLD